MLIVLSTCTTVGSKEKFTHNNEGNKLVGDLLLPSGSGPHPVVVFNHGDGAIPADAHGYYQPLMDAFVSAGVAILSWDKPGVRRSSGNWLNQSMQDRAVELLLMVRLLKQRTDIDSKRVGLWGISQAGWVMPLAVSQSSEFAFMISVSPAISWQEQSQFLTQSRMASEGYSSSEIADALALNEEGIARLKSDSSYESYLSQVAKAPKCCASVMDKQRWNFVRLNIDTDARPSLLQMKIPVLAIFGGNDLNVDVKHSAQTYEHIKTAANNPDVTIRVFDNADHALYRSSEKRLRGAGAADIWYLIKIGFQGANAFAPDYIDSTVEWALARFR